MGSLRSYFWELLEILLVGALAVGLVASISLPRLPPLYIARTHLDDAVIQTSKGLSHNVSEVRVSLAAFLLSYYEPSWLIFSSLAQFGIW